MKTSILALGLVAMACVLTDALTLHPLNDLSNANQGQGRVESLLDQGLIQMKKRTPKSLAATLKHGGLLVKREEKPETTCQAYIDGMRSLLVSAEKSMEDPETTKTVYAEVTSRQPAPAQSVLDKLDDLKKQIAQARKDIVAAFGEEINPKTTYPTADQVKDIITTTSDLIMALEDAKVSLGEKDSKPYDDLIEAVKSVQAYASSHVARRDCTSD
ncbi:hypothetical protein BGW39_009626 [Mortierella sp. 14UC]|nr:hypothetical protein BGW39_009626 [Mortierella sp. 14UC]